MPPSLGAREPPVVGEALEPDDRRRERPCELGVLRVLLEKSRERPRLALEVRSMPLEDPRQRHAPDVGLDAKIPRVVDEPPGRLGELTIELARPVRLARELRAAPRRIVDREMDARILAREAVQDEAHVVERQPVAR